MLAPIGLRVSKQDQKLILSYPLEAELAFPHALTEAERFVAKALVRGLSLRAIAQSRGTSHRTVANQTRSIYRKLGVRCRLELGILLRAPGTARPGIDAWRAVVDGEWTLVHVFVADGWRFMIAERGHAKPLLDEREQAVFSLRANAKAIKEIAIDLRMSPATVCRTLTRAMSKLGLETNTDVLRFA